MKHSLIKPHELDAALLQTWSDIQQSDEALGSPYFCPEFTQAVAEVREDVEIAIIEAGGSVQGFLPFQRDESNVARPVGGRLSDFHGLICRPELQCDIQRLVRDCGLRAWHFDHVVASQAAFSRFLLAKLPIYSQFLAGRQREWTRTERSEQPTSTGRKGVTK